MSESTFMRQGFGRLVLIASGSPPYPAPWPIRVYEIGEANFVGVRYPDSRQVHSRSWWQRQIEQDAGKSVEGDPDAEQPEEPEQFVDEIKPVLRKRALRKRG